MSENEEMLAEVTYRVTRETVDLHTKMMAERWEAVQTLQRDLRKRREQEPTWSLDEEGHKYVDELAKMLKADVTWVYQGIGIANGIINHPEFDAVSKVPRWKWEMIISDLQKDIETIGQITAVLVEISTAVTA